MTVGNVAEVSNGRHGEGESNEVGEEQREANDRKVRKRRHG
jgi:hypothetical protein